MNNKFCDNFSNIITSMNIALNTNVTKGGMDGKMACSKSWTKPLVDVNELLFEFL